MEPLIELIKTLFIDKLDYTLTYISITVLLFFYGFSIARRTIQKVEGTRTQKFIIFIIMVIFGINLLLILFTNFILSLTDSQLKWIVIIALIVWSFVKFDKEILK